MRRILVGIFSALFLLAAFVVWNPSRDARQPGFGIPPDVGTPMSVAGSAAAAGSAVAERRSPDRLVAAGGASPSRSGDRRSWDAGFFASLQSSAKGAAIRFDLANGQPASGTIQHTERKNGELIYVSGVLSEPEPGKFFFQKQTGPGVSGAFVGVVEFPGSKTAWRIEPTGPGGTPELVARRLDEVVCVNLIPAAAADSEEIPPLYPDNFPTVPIPEYQGGTVVLESLHGAVGVIYLDFHAGYTPTWGGINYASQNFSNTKIRDIWQYMSEDFLPFNINVTTDLKVFQAAPETSRIRVIFTPTTTAAPGSGGVAYYDSWNWSGDTPCWVFNSGTKSAAEAGSHEVGHSVNLRHDGKDPSTTYYSGHSSGATGWAPIMGTGYTRDVVQFSKGEYTDANNTENDLNIIVAQNSIDYRTDDTGSNLAASRYLETYAGNTAWAQGVVERTADTDAFQFTTTGGALSLTASPSPVSWANLGISATLTDAGNTIIASNNPQNVLSASISTNLAAGTYTFRVTGAGRNDPVTDGFSDYCSLGYYTITGSVAGVRLPTRFTIAENTANATLVGVVTANNPGGDPLIYTIVSGNTGSTFALNSAGNLTVANNALLNYETLAANVQLAVQYEMFVNITNTVTPANTELNRRVVVTITNVNEAPTLSAGFTTNVLEHTLVGTAIGKVNGTDPDYFTLLTYSIVSGDTNGMFSIGNESGILTVAGDLIAASQNVYSLKVVVSDSSLTATSTVTVTVQANNSPFHPGELNYAAYLNLPDNTIASLTNAPNFPLAPDVEKLVTLAEGDMDWADDYGATLRGYLIAPTNGSYRFFLASDNAGQLFLSTNALASASTNPANMKLIASIATDAAANSRQWNKYASQRSLAYTLTGGQAYYIEARMKETFGGDNLAIGWTAPGFTGTNVIPGTYLAPFDAFTTDDLVWTGSGSVNTGWHDPNNWSPAYRPRQWNTVTFDTFGSTNGAGLVDSVVSANITTGPIIFRNQTPDFHTIQINPGVTLAFTNGFETTGEPFGYRGSLSDSSLTGYVTIKGTGRLIVGDTNNPHPAVGNQIRVHAVESILPPSTTEGPHTNGPFMCTLDMSGLDYFATATGEIKVGASASSGRGTRGTLILAKTNLVICGTVTNNYYGLIVGSAHGGDYQPGGTIGHLLLGQQNVILAHSIKAGAQRAQLGTVKFRSGLINPTVKMRNVDGVSAVGLIGIGDNYRQSSTGGTVSTPETSTGIMDLSGGTVDILVSALRVGRSINATGASSGGGNGTLTWTGGTITTIGSMQIGRQQGDNRGSCTGVVNVRSNAVWLGIGEGEDLIIGSDAGGAGGQSGTGNGTLNIVYGGQVFMTNSIVEDIAGIGSSTINLTNGNLTVGGVVRVDNLNVINSTLNLTIGSTNNDANPVCLVTNLSVATAVTINLSGGDLVPGQRYPLIKYSGNFTGGGFGVVSLGTQPAGTVGRLLNNTVNKSIDYFVTNAAPAARWSGSVNGNWNISTTANWTDTASSLATTYQQSGVPGDAVAFDDTASGTTTVNLTTSLAPASLGVTNSTKTYIFNGVGKLSGATGLIKSGSGTMILTNSGANDFTGGVLILGGSLRLGLASNRLPVVNLTIADVASASLVLSNQNQTLASLSGGGAAGGNINLGAGALTTTNAGTYLGKISGSGIFRKTGGGTQTLGGSNSYSGGTYISGIVTLINTNGSGVGLGPVEIASGTLNVGNGAAAGLSPSVVITNNGTLNFNATNDTALSAIHGTGPLNKNNTNTVTITGPGTYTGVTAINGGALRLSHGNALGNPANATTIDNSGDERLELTGNIIVPENLMLNMKPSASGPVGHVVNVSGTNTLTGAITATSGGSYWAFRSDAGKMIVNGTFTFTAAATGARSLRLFGDADGDWVTSYPDGVVAGSIGRVRKEGIGTWTLSGNNTYSGNTLVLGGRLLVNGVIQSLDAVTVGDLGNPTIPATLGGTGLIKSSVLVNSNGIFAPGNSIGTLTITTNLILSAGCTNIFEMNTDTLAHDLVTGLSNVTYGGTLVLVPSGGGAALTNGASVKLFSAASYTGSFTATNLPSLGAGLFWDTSALAINGTLAVALSVSTTPTNLTFSLTGNALEISWPADHTGWRLEGQTNSVNVGINNAWFTVPGSTTTNQVILTVSPANGAVFYRLVYP